MSSEDLDARRVLVFLAFAFGVSWAVGGVVYATGGLSGGPEVLPGIPLWLVLLATGYMWGPAVANVLTRVVTGEGRDDLLLRPRIRATWRYWLAAWLVPPVLVLLGVGAFFAAFPGYFDPSLAATADALRSAGVDPEAVPGGLQGFLVLQVVQAVVVAPLVNAPSAFGEEFGWRAYLLPKLLPLGERRAVLAHGVIWGAWHWPVIAMGYNYGVDYPGAPWTGMAAMTWFAVVVGVFLAWLTLRADSVWPAVVAHAAVNGVGGIGALLVRGDPNSLLGPAAVGVVASLPWVVVAAWLLARDGAFAAGDRPSGLAGDQ